MHSFSPRARLLVLNVVLLLAYGLFLRCYFPVKQNVSPSAQYEGFSAARVSDATQSRKSDKVVLMLIDALRVDFVMEEQSPMEFLRKTMKNGKSSAYIAKVHPPTVTMPRIKAITTGSIPGFVDVVLNFGSSALTEDNIITQMKKTNLKTIFYGDDTWLNLFPDHFTRHDGTTSFFVTDYTEVDNNVTRHLDKELRDGDFDVMILHYLGLDHIGHMAGPTSPLIKPKLIEMDRVAEKVFAGLQKLATELPNLLVVCGDHGMSDQGGHGGATESETRVPVVFIPTKNGQSTDPSLTFPEEISQTDICPTLSYLLGLPIPQNNVGRLLVDMFHNHSVEQKAEAVLVNTQQIMKLFQHNIPNYEQEPAHDLCERTLKAHHHWLNHLKPNMSAHAWHLHGNKIIQQYTDCMVAMTSKMSSSLTKYDLYALTVFIILIWLVFLALLFGYNRPFSRPTQSFLLYESVTLIGCSLCHLTLCTSQSSHSELLCGTSAISLMVQICVVICMSVLIPMVVHLILTSGSSSSLQKVTMTNTGAILVGGTVLHTLSLLSSSFVEEEHQTWYFFTVTFHILLLLKVAQSGVHNGTAKKETGKSSFSLYSENTDNGEPSCNHNSEHQFTKLKCRPKSVVEQNDVFHHLLQHPLKEKESAQPVVSVRPKYTLPWKPVTATLMVLVLCRVMRSMNQTGDKWLLLPDIGDFLVRPENKLLLSALTVGALSVIIYLRQRWLLWKQKLIFSFCSLTVYVYKARTGSFYIHSELIPTPGIWEARLALILVLVFMLADIYRIIHAGEWKSTAQSSSESHATCTRTEDGRRCGIPVLQSVQSTWILLMLLVSKPHNVVLIAMVILDEHILWQHLSDWIMEFPVSLRTLYCLWMGQASYFYQGNSNSLSTVDVAAGYIGQEDYNPVLIGLLLTLSTYTMPIFWFIVAVKYVIAKDTDMRGKKLQLSTKLVEMAHMMTLTCSLVLSVYTVLTVVQRYHLFVWTVFSPKLLYEGMRTVVLSIFSCFILLFSYCTSH